MHITEVCRVAAAAWAKIKPPQDPEFNGCALSHREKLIAQVEALERGGNVTNDFERAAKDIMDADLKASKVEAPKVEEPTPDTEKTSEPTAPESESAPAVTTDATPAKPEAKTKTKAAPTAKPKKSAPTS